MSKLAFAALGTVAVVGTLYASSSISPEGDVSNLSMLTTASPAAETASTDAADATKNVLYLFVDDFRPQMSAFGRDFMSTPNMDALMDDSILFREMHVQTAWCCPSRSSSLTSRRPETTRVYKFQYFREEGLPENVLTLPGYFKDQGYTTLGMGKIFHPVPDTNGDGPSWSDAFWAPETYSFWQTGPSWYAATADELEKAPHPDAEVASHAIELLEGFAETKEPFFLGVGFYKPHLPMVFPEEYGDLYPLDSIDVVADEDEDLKWVPDASPEIAYSFYPELKGHEDIGNLVKIGAYNETLPDETAKYVRRAYYSCVSHTDYQLGRVLDALDDLGLRDTTIVSLQGDHGWMLGEHADWDKQSNWEIALKTPLIIRVPGVTDDGPETDALVEAVDVFPTMVELAGLDPIETCPMNWQESQQEQICTEGQSLVPLIEDPEREWKEAVFSQFQKLGWEDDFGDGDYMGFSTTTKDWHYVEWIAFDFDNNLQNWDIVKGVELYDRNDDAMENYNLAENEAYADVVSEMHDILKAGWQDQLVEV